MGPGHPKINSYFLGAAAPTTRDVGRPQVPYRAQLYATIPWRGSAPANDRAANLDPLLPRNLSQLTQQSWSMSGRKASPTSGRPSRLERGPWQRPRGLPDSPSYMQLSRGEDGEPESSAPSSFAPSIRRSWRPVLLWQDAFGTMGGIAPPRGCRAPSWCGAMKRAARRLFGGGRDFPLRALVVEHDVRKVRDHHDGNDVRVGRWPSDPT